MTNDVDQQLLLAYFAMRADQRADQVTRALSVLTPFERRLLREAAVMGYVTGVRVGPHRDRIPPDSAIVSEVVVACASFDDLYPLLAAATDGDRLDDPSTRGDADV